MRLGKRGFVLVGVIVVVALIVVGSLIYMNREKITGKVLWPVDSNRQFKAAVYSCDDGRSLEVESKNCRSAHYWYNDADKFCRETGASNKVKELRLFLECQGNEIVPITPGSLQIGDDCTADNECASAYCQGLPYGRCAEIQTTTGSGTTTISTTTSTMTPIPDTTTTTGPEGVAYGDPIAYMDCNIPAGDGEWQCGGVTTTLATTTFTFFVSIWSTINKPMLPLASASSSESFFNSINKPMLPSASATPWEEWLLIKAAEYIVNGIQNICNNMAPAPTTPLPTVEKVNWADYKTCWSIFKYSNNEQTGRVYAVYADKDLSTNVCQYHIEWVSSLDGHHSVMTFDTSNEVFHVIKMYNPNGVTNTPLKDVSINSVVLNADPNLHSETKGKVGRIIFWMPRDFCVF